MAITQTTYTGNGSTTNYSFTFEYLKQADVKVTLDTVATTAFTFANATTLAFTTAPANGVAIRIFRDTAIDTLSSTFFPGSAIKAEDLNQNFTQNLYVTQESDFEVDTANTTANTAKTTADTALTNSTTAITTANAATTTANTADTNASAAVTTANTASTNATAAVNTANTASTNATAAVNTANTASTNATNAVTTANSAATDAATAISTANAATTAANTATATANSATTTANGAVTTANTASTNASAAVTTANTADTNATAAVATANAAQSAVSSAAFYSPVANVAGIPGSPSNNDRVEVADSTGIQSFTPLTGYPVGFVGNSGLTARIQYSTSGSTWNWVDYFANDPENRYLTESLPVVKGDSTNGSGQITLNCENNSHGIKIKGPPHSAAANYTLTLPTTSGSANQRLKIDGSGQTSWITPDHIESASGTNSITVGGTELNFYTNSTNQLTLGTTGDLTLMYGALKFWGGFTNNFLTIKRASGSQSYDLTLPTGPGTSGQALTTDGNGVLSFNTISTIAICDGGNFANGSSLVQTSTTFDGGSF
jgi:hypothetical protein